MKTSIEEMKQRKNEQAMRRQGIASRKNPLAAEEAIKFDESHAD